MSSTSYNNKKMSPLTVNRQNTPVHRRWKESGNREGKSGGLGAEFTQLCTRVERWWSPPEAEVI